MNLINIVTDSVSLYNEHNLFHKSQSNEQSRHELELELMRQQHEKELKAAKQAYLINTFTDIEQYCQELNENLINSTRDAERDMVDQRNQQYQTILVASAVMLTALFTVLVQGRLPVESNLAVKLTFSISTAGSTGFILVNVLLCIQLIYRVSQFMNRKTESHLRKINEAIQTTKQTMKKLHGSHPSDRPYFATLAQDAIELEWGSHEKMVHRHLEERNKLIVLREAILSEAIPFNQFWDENCKIIGATALICFYIGTALMLVATMIYMWAWYKYTYKNFAGAMIGLVTILISLVVSLSIAVYLRFLDPTIKDLSLPVIEPEPEVQRRPLSRRFPSRKTSKTFKTR